MIWLGKRWSEAHDTHSNSPNCFRIPPLLKMFSLSRNRFGVRSLRTWQPRRANEEEYLGAGGWRGSRRERHSLRQSAAALRRRVRIVLPWNRPLTSNVRRGRGFWRHHHPFSWLVRLQISSSCLLASAKFLTYLRKGDLFLRKSNAPTTSVFILTWTTVSLHFVEITFQGYKKKHCLVFIIEWHHWFASFQVGST